MKIRTLLLSFAAVAIMGIAVVLTVSGGKEQRMYYPGTTSIENGIDGAVKWLANIRNNKQTGTISMSDLLLARKQIAELSHNKSLGITWRELGPSNVGGRTRAILVDKNNSNLLYAGGVSGGLWKSTTGGTSWQQVTSFPDMNVACIGQNPLNGNLYVGTGESFAIVDSPYGTPGFVGSGLYESTDGGLTWAIYNNAKPVAGNDESLLWAFVNRIAFDPITGRIYVATNKGIKYWNGNHWVNPLSFLGSAANCNTVVVGSDRTVITVVANKVYVSFGGSGNGDSATFVESSPATALGRTEVAIAPSNPNIVYALSATTAGALKGVYKSTDRGDNWTLVAPGGAPAFNIFGDNVQGGYDNVISISPSNPDVVWAGGVYLWKYVAGGNFTQMTVGVDVHADAHAIVFDPANPNIMYVGSDGGINKSTNQGATWQKINKNYNVTQLYYVANSINGSVMGGTQDNSVPYIKRVGYDSTSADLLFGGDGGWAAFSAINTDALFGTMQYGGVWRTPDQGVTYQSATESQFFSPTMIAGLVPGTDPSYGPFVTPLLHWESFNNTYSPDSVTFVADTNYSSGAVVVVHSSNNNYPFAYTLPHAMIEGQSIRVQDIVSSHFFVAISSGVWMTKKALNFSITPQWIKISSVANVENMSISDDGNYMFLGTSGGTVYRISNILAVKDSVNGTITSPYCVIDQTMIKSFSGRSVTSTAIDPNDPSRLLVTLGNYGNTDYVYFSENALDATPTFTSKQGTTTGKKLPAMPLYSGLIEMVDGNRVLIGTEYGVFATNDITKNAATIEWTQENTGLSPVPVFSIRQQTRLFPGMTNKWGTIYIGTHGRGFFETEFFATAVPEIDKPAITKPTLNVYPNPAVDFTNVNFTLTSKASVTVNIYDLNGRLVKSIDMSQKSIGSHQESIDCSGLDRGTYIIQLVAGKESTTAKFTVMR